MQDIKQGPYVEHVLDHYGVASIERAILSLFHATKSSSMVGQA